MFLVQLWTIRYGKLLENLISTDVVPFSKDLAIQFDTAPIQLPDNKEIMQLCSFSGSANRKLGTLVTATVKDSKSGLVARSLSGDSEKAQRQAKSKLHQLLRRTLLCKSI
jgi:hypothetical protein